MKSESKAERKFKLLMRLQAMGFSYEEAQQLRRIEMTLHRWAEAECNGVIQRDAESGKPFRVVSYCPPSRKADFCEKHYPIADREAGALKRLKAIVLARNTREAMPGDTLNLITPYHQGDPRGCALYLLKGSDLSPDYSIDQIYTRGLAVCI